MSLLRLIFIWILAPLHGFLIYVIAYGPWGSLHQIFISVFKALYKIDYPSSHRFKNLGEFFLRPVEIDVSRNSLVSPVEGLCFEGASPVLLNQTISAKGIDYAWKSFYELNASKFRNGMYWNLYLAPQNYHWVHSPADGTQLEGIRCRGAKLPVNALGRWLEPKLYAVNERLSFKFQTEEFGEVILLCIGAMGVSSLYCDKGVVEYERWTNLSGSVKKGERLLAFRLGSTVLMLTEKPLSSPLQKSVLKVGDELA